MVITVVDGMGGGIGCQIIGQIRKELPAEVEIVALGTNAAATAAMLKAGASKGATGENALLFSLPRAHTIAGPLGIIIPHAMLGEISPAVAAAVAGSNARKLLLPVPQSHVELVGMDTKPLTVQIKELVERLKDV